MDSEKIAVAMSGEVDSFMGAMVLVQQGFEVEGFILNIKGEIESIQSAIKIARKLNITLHVIDSVDVFNTFVIQGMINEYSSGNVPNPCILCKKTIKWRFLYSRAKELGFNYISTGHYARISQGESGRYRLLKGLDKQKDQSYFLSFLTQEGLSHTLFPLGERSKSEVRNIAKNNDFQNHHKPESQDYVF